MKPANYLIVIIALLSCGQEENFDLPYSFDSNLNKYSNGKSIIRYDSGNIEFEIYFQNNVPHGKWVWFYETGNLKAEYEYDNGKLISLNFYDLDGKLTIENGTGSFYEYYKNGSLKSKISYKKNKIDGIFIRWHENGNVSTKGVFKDGKTLELSSWDENGTPLPVLGKENKVLEFSQ